MKQIRKGKNWHFGLKLHIGADQRGIVHSVRATDAAVADVTQLPELLRCVSACSTLPAMVIRVRRSV